MLRVRGLTKAYGPVQALSDVDLDVDAGQIVSLLGPNGAGKTTLVSIVAGLRRADAGQVEIDGLDALARTPEVRRRIGLAPQELGIYPVVTVSRNLQLFGELAGLRRRALGERIAEVAPALGLDDLLDRLAGELSGGQKRRLHTAIALLHEPPLLLLDEATVGADVETREALLSLVRRLADDGAAVLYSTHHLYEVEALRASVAILDRGRMIARGDVPELVAAHATPVVDFTFAGPPPPLPVATQRVAGHRVRVATDEPARTIAEVTGSLDGRGVALVGVEVLQSDLKAVYLALTGHRYVSADREGTAVRSD